MSVSAYSIVMAVIWFTLAVLIGNFTLHRASRYGLRFVTVVLFLSILRIFLPLDLDHSTVIRSVKFYPFLQNMMRQSLIGRITVGTCLIACWMFGSGICLLLLVRKLTIQRRFHISACSRKHDQKLQHLFEEVAKEMGYNGPAALAVSNKTATAYQAGFVHPCIILPWNVDAFSEADIRNMLRHELCHFQGRDLWIKIGLQLMSCALWWNPVVYLLNRNIEQMLELRCDRRACKHLSKMEQISYLETLLRLLSHGRLTETSWAAMDYSGCAEETEIIQRFQILLRGTGGPKSRAKCIIGVGLCAILFAASYCVILQPWGEPAITIDEDATTALPEDSYILRTADGKLELYYGNSFYADIADSALKNEPFNKLPIINERTK